jgi:hypothetical protein
VRDRRHPRLEEAAQDREVAVLKLEDVGIGGRHQEEYISAGILCYETRPYRLSAI